MERTSQSETETVEVSEGVFLTQLAVGERMSVQHLRMEPGAKIPAHDHHHEQLGFVFRGEQTFLLEEEELVVGPGNSYAIPGGEPHAVENRGEEVLEAVDVFSPPRPEPDWLE